MSFEYLIVVLKQILSLTVKIILFCLGWKLPKERDLIKFNEHDRTVAIFSHTTYIDFFLLLLYYLAFPEGFKNIRPLVVAWTFEYMGLCWLLNKMGAIPATKLSEKNGGATERIISELSQQDKFIFLISPKGTILKKEWRSGYLAISSHFEAHLMVVGVDYEKKKCIVGKAIKYDDPELTKILHEQLSKIVPLFPECEIVDIRKHNPHKRGLIDYSRVFIISYFIGIYIIISMMKRLIY